MNGATKATLSRFLTRSAIVDSYDWAVSGIRQRVYRREIDPDRRYSRPRIGMHAVFIAKENILFLEEWIQYHRALGIEYFFLYDNSAVETTKESFIAAGAVAGKIAKRGIPYDYLVTMTHEDIQGELDRLQREIPNVYVNEWSPVNEDGRIWFGQNLCQTQAALVHRDQVDFMFFADMDEYLVPGPGVDLRTLCQRVSMGGYVGAEFWGIAMDNRYRHLDRYVYGIDRACGGFHREGRGPTGKILCYLPRTKRVDIHRFSPFHPRLRLDFDELHNRHYKCHHSVESVPIDPLPGPRLSRGRDWKLSAVRPDWKEVIRETAGTAGSERAKSFLS